MKYYSEKLDKLFDTEADLKKAESESVTNDTSMKEQLLLTASKVNKLSQAYDALQEEFVNNISEIVNDPVIPTFTEQFRKYIEAEAVEDDSDLDSEVVDAFMFLFQVMEDLELYGDDDSDANCCGECEDCDKNEVEEDDGNYHAQGETKNGTKWSVDIVKDKTASTESFADVLGRFWHSLLQ